MATLYLISQRVIIQIENYFFRKHYVTLRVLPCQLLGCSLTEQTSNSGNICPCKKTNDQNRGCHGYSHTYYLRSSCFIILPPLPSLRRCGPCFLNDWVASIIRSPVVERAHNIIVTRWIRKAANSDWWFCAALQYSSWAHYSGVVMLLK